MNGVSVIWDQYLQKNITCVCVILGTISSNKNPDGQCLEMLRQTEKKQFGGSTTIGANDRSGKKTELLHGGISMTSLRS